MSSLNRESFGVIPIQKFLDGWKVLVILHLQGHHWSFPKGGASPGESHLESAKRELEEETGLLVKKILQDKPFVESYSFFQSGKKVTKTVYYYPALVEGELKLQPEEVRDAKWLSLDEAKALLTFKETRTICEKIAEFLKDHVSFSE